MDRVSRRAAMINRAWAWAWAWGAGAAAVVVLAAGCGGDTTAGGPGPGAATSAPAAPSSSGSAITTPPTLSSSASASVGGGKDDLPEDFPLPEEADLGTVIRDDNQVAAQITLPETAKAYDFWRSALPKAGYTVTKTEAVSGDLGSIHFRGHGCTEKSVIAVTSGSAALNCVLG